MGPIDYTRDRGSVKGRDCRGIMCGWVTCGSQLPQEEGAQMTTSEGGGSRHNKITLKVVKSVRNNAKDRRSGRVKGGGKGKKLHGHHSDRDNKKQKWQKGVWVRGLEKKKKES